MENRATFVPNIIKLPPTFHISADYFETTLSVQSLPFCQNADYLLFYLLKYFVGIRSRQFRASLLACTWDSCTAAFTLTYDL